MTLSNNENRTDVSCAPPATQDRRLKAAALPLSFAWRTVWLGHAVVAVIWVWWMPGGFPFWHVRFWANRVIPGILLGLAVAGVVGAEKRKAWLYYPLTLFVPLTWTASLLAGEVLFPVSSQRLLLPGLVGISILWGLYIYTCRRQRIWLWPLLPVVLLSLMVGVGLPWTQRAAEPDTLPRNLPIPVVQLNHDVTTIPARLELSKHFAVRPLDGSVTADCKNLRIEMQPLLRFESVSPDRCWTLLAPRTTPPDSYPKLTGFGVIDQVIYLEYGGAMRHFLRLEAAKDGATIDAFTELEQPVFSHLNSFCEITINGHRNLALSFSPCPDASIAVLPADYPSGRPARHAYLAQDGSFHVVEAQSGEKGPFRPLATGHLGREEPLTITVHDEEQSVCRITFFDWAAQADVSLSPTAGWGVPVNALEFQRLDDALGATVKCWVTLAATSVGRGWDSVGHRPGVYRNRMRIECPGE